jgi:uncharacterized membrane protein YeaQ/YmgE (transglycosylase-associated protein family)
MDMIIFLVVGLMVGYAGSRLASWKREDIAGRTIVLGILGALGGAMFARSLGYAAGDLGTFVGSIFGAVAVVAGYVGIVTRRTA